MSEKGDSSEIEFRSCDDDAWYNVQVTVEGEEGDSFGRLRVKFCGLNDQEDHIFHSEDFSNLKELDDFSARFRTLSLQLQDADCYKISKGFTVCASHHFKKDDLRFFDAVVEGVDHQEHSFETGEEECLCTFILCWLHGPLAGHMTAENIESICRVQFNVEKDPAVASFLKIVREKIHITSDSNLLYNVEVTSVSTANHHGKISGLNVEHEQIFSQHLKQESRCARKSSNGTWSSKWMTDYSCEMSEQDKDIGGAGNYYLIFIENLEKDLSPVSIMEFVHEEVSIPCQAIVCRSLSSELCTRGNILLDGKKNFEKLCEFLDSPDRIIVSSRGRPWLITEKISVHDTMRVSIGPLVHKSQKFLQTGNTRTTNKLKIVYSGTKEYRMASELRDNFRAFSNHQKVLHKRLSFEEDKILQLYNAKHIV